MCFFMYFHGVTSIGTRGAECPLDSKTTVTNREKEKKKRGEKLGGKKRKKTSGKNQEKRGKIGKKMPKLGRFFHFAPPDK